MSKVIRKPADSKNSNPPVDQPEGSAPATSMSIPPSVSKRTRAAFGKAISSPETPIPPPAKSRSKQPKGKRGTTNPIPHVDLDAEGSNEVNLLLVFCQKHISSRVCKSLLGPPWKRNKLEPLPLLPRYLLPLPSFQLTFSRCYLFSLFLLSMLSLSLVSSFLIWTLPPMAHYSPSTNN